MSEIKDVTCQHCTRTIAQRRGNELYRNGVWERHDRAFNFQCPFFGCNEWQRFQVNRVNRVNTVKNLAFAVSLSNG